MRAERTHRFADIGHWWWSALILGLALVLCVCQARAADDDDDDEPATPEKGATSTEVLNAPSESSTRDLLAFALRIDSSFSAGAQYQEGFSIPSIYLSAFGDLSNLISYRLSFGETREFSSVQLPQIMPVEAYVDFAITHNEDIKTAPEINWRVGMFTPTFNPWWTPDLTDLQIPTYGVTDQALFLSRDIGTELSYQSSPNGFKVGAGAFNGNGIFSVNTNDSRAFSAFVSDGFGSDDLRFAVGVSGYGVFQADATSPNYVSNWVGDVWATLTFGSTASIMVEGFGGVFDDAYRTVQASGGAAGGWVNLLDWLRIYGRVETLNHDPTNQNSLSLAHYEIGPVLLLEPAVKIFALFEYYNYGDGVPETSFLIRLRLTI